MAAKDRNATLWAVWLFFLCLIFLPSVWSVPLEVGRELVRLAAGGEAMGLPSPRASDLLKRSIAIAAGATALALFLGTVTGYLTTRVAFPGRRLLFGALLIPFFLPAYCYCMAWLEWFGPTSAAAPAATASQSFPYSAGSAMLVLALHLFPWVHLVAGVGFASMERHVEEAAQMTLPGRRRLARITLPLVAGILAVAALFIFVHGLKNNAIPELLRQRVFATEIMVAYGSFMDERQAVLKGLACVAVAMAALGVAAWIALRRSRIAIEGLSSPWRAEPAGQRGSGLLAVLIVLVVLDVAVVLPLATLIRMAGAWSNYVIVWKSALPEIAQGLQTAAATATLCIVLGFLLANWIARSSRVVSGITVVAVFFLFALPPPVLDVGLIRFWDRRGPLGWVYDSSVMLVLGQTAAFLPIAVIAFWVALRRLDPHLVEAAEMARLPWRTTALRILCPLLSDWFIGVWALIFVLSLNDAEAAVLLSSAGGATVAARILTMLHLAPEPQFAALCVIQVALSALVIGAVAAAATAWRRLNGRPDARIAP